ncbi:MAG: thiolase family protein [Thaumarchaeota archaeon]|nr:thiolase family protein [Nitrososphaerota archaeon]
MSIRGKAVICGYGETPVTRGKKERGEPVLSFWDYLAWASELTVKNAKLEIKDFDGQGLAVIHPIVEHPINFGCEVAEHLGISPGWIITPSHGGASGVVALQQAVAAVSSGVVDRVLCLGGDSPMSYRPMTLLQHRKDFENPFGVMGPNSSFAMVMRLHMERYGTKAEHTGKIAVTQRDHAILNPNAIFRSPIKLEDYLNSRVIADPLRMLDVVMPVNGGAGFVVCRSEDAQTDNPVYILGLGECDNYYHGSKALPDITYTGVTVSSKIALDCARLEPKDMHLFEPYDDYTIAVLMQLEDAGFCRKGEGGKFVEDTDLSYKGALPVNTGGGQLSGGQAGLASGFLNLLEAVRQLRGEGGSRQVRNAKYGMVTGLGNLQYAKNLAYTSVAILGNEV